MKQHPPPLTWDRLLELAQAGHDDFEAPITPPRARQLVASGREHFAAERLTVELADIGGLYAKLRAEADAANAALERVRDAVRDTAMTGRQQRKAIRAALASQPEAPCQSNTYEVWRGTEKRKDQVVLETTDIELAARTACADLSGQTFWGMKRQPEAPKGPAAEAETPLRQWDRTIARLERDLAAADAQIAERDATIADERRICGAQEQRIRDLERMVYDLGVAGDAANARADAAELDAKMQDEARARWQKRGHAAETERDQLAQKLEAAERGERDAVAALDANWVTHQRIVKAECERDQLAARVRELEEGREERLRVTDSLAARVMCTPEERKVLEACAKRGPLKVWGPAVWEAEKARREVELANRAAKASKVCAGCGLLQGDEPTVQMRSDGTVRCASCAANERS